MSKQRFLDLANAATPVQRDQADAWYSEAHDLAIEMASFGRVSFDQACCIISAYSIRRHWATNKRFAMDFATGGRPSVMRSIDRIIDNIMEFDDPYTALNGDKTNSFARNIAGDMHAVTLDVWMIRAVDLNDKDSLNKGEYHRVSQELRDAALEYGILPAYFQALVWIVMRDSYVKGE